MDLFEKITGELENNPKVIIVKKYEKNCSKKDFSNGDCIFKHIVIAPKTGIYNSEELQKFMTGLIKPEIAVPSITKPFGQNENPESISIGNIVFSKTVGEMITEEKIHWKDSSTLHFAKDFLSEKYNNKVISKKVDLSLSIKIIPFFDGIAAWHILDGVKTGEEAALMLDRSYFPNEIERFKQRYHSEELLRQN